VASRLRLAARAGAATTAVAVVAALLASCSSTHNTSNGADASATQQASPVAPPDPGPYAALGDSYTSGAGIPDQVGNPPGCGRSSHNYPALVAESLHLSASEVRDVSCESATIGDLSTPQVTDAGTNPAQLNALTANTALVTLGIGGNDVDFAGTVIRCAALDLAPSLIGGKASDVAPCRAHYTSDGTDQIGQKITTVGRQLDGALAQIRARSPHARILVVGYPALFPADGATCAHEFSITAADVTFLNAEELQFNSMLRQQARAAGATYVDTYTPSVGHDACSDPATRWIEPLVPLSAAAPLHPNARGAQGMADAVVQVLNSAAS
jgi:lysophospholipase L1-like esterase